MTAMELEEPVKDPGVGSLLRKTARIMSRPAESNTAPPLPIPSATRRSSQPVSSEDSNMEDAAAPSVSTYYSNGEEEPLSIFHLKVKLSHSQESFFCTYDFAALPFSSQQIELFLSDKDINYTLLNKVAELPPLAQKYLNEKLKEGNHDLLQVSDAKPHQIMTPFGVQTTPSFFVFVRNTPHTTLPQKDTNVTETTWYSVKDSGVPFPKFESRRLPKSTDQCESDGTSPFDRGFISVTENSTSGTRIIALYQSISASGFRSRYSHDEMRLADYRRGVRFSTVNELNLSSATASKVFSKAKATSLSLSDQPAQQTVFANTVFHSSFAESQSRIPSFGFPSGSILFPSGICRRQIATQPSEKQPPNIVTTTASINGWGNSFGTHPSQGSWFWALPKPIVETKETLSSPYSLASTSSFGNVPTSAPTPTSQIATTSPHNNSVALLGSSVDSGPTFGAKSKKSKRGLFRASPISRPLDTRTTCTEVIRKPPFTFSTDANRLYAVTASSGSINKTCSFSEVEQPSWRDHTSSPSETTCVKTETTSSPCTPQFKPTGANAIPLVSTTASGTAPAITRAATGVKIPKEWWQVPN